LGQVWFADALEANEKAEKPPQRDVGEGNGIVATTKGMLTFQEFLAKKAMVLPDLFRIQPFIGLAQPIPLKSIKRTPKPRHRLKGVEKRRGRQIKRQSSYLVR
jgi:hypothetical protein